MRTRHLLIDLDGTLLESRGLLLRLEFIARSVGRLRGLAGPLGALRALRAVRVALSEPALAGTGRTNTRRAAEAFARAVGLAETEAHGLLDAAVGEIFPRLRRHFHPVPGALEFLEWARPRYPLTLATNPVWPEPIVKLRLEWAQVDPAHFTHITHAGVMHACKPSVEYYREVLALFSGGASPGDFLLVGDDLRKDLPATRAGIPVFILSDEAVATPLDVGAAPAWRGSYAALRALLESRAAE
jgi:FMN phosphatase YigB (HAD superfamily)